MNGYSVDVKIYIIENMITFWAKLRFALNAGVCAHTHTHTIGIVLTQEN